MVCATIRQLSVATLWQNSRQVAVTSTDPPLLHHLGAQQGTAKQHTEPIVVAACVAAGPFISYVDLSQMRAVEQQLLQQHHARAQGHPDAAAAGAQGVDWSAVGGRSLHAQQDVWGE